MTVPDTFKAETVNRNLARAETLEELEKTRQLEPAATQDVPMEDADASDVPQKRRVDPSEWLTAIDHDAPLEENQIMRPEEEPDDDDTYAHVDSPILHDGEAQSDLSSVEHSVTNPGSEGPGVQLGAGASDRATRASVESTAAVPSLPFEWDQLGMFMTFKIIETLHNDIEGYVEKFRDRFDEVYGDESLEETLAALPQISIRYPGVVDARSKQRGEEKTKELMPLSASVPLKASRYCDVAAHIKHSRASKGLTEAVHSFAHGRAIAYNDPEVLEHEAEQRGLDSGISMDGNLFARSTWVRFTLSALDARGMLTPEEEKRVMDQGLFMRLRTRNVLAIKEDRDNEDTEPLLAQRKGKTVATQHTFSAQERAKRKLGETVEDDDVLRESVSCKKRSLERLRESQLLKRSMEMEPSL